MSAWFYSINLYQAWYIGLDTVKRLIITRNKGLNKDDYLIDENANGKWQENIVYSLK